MKEIGLVIPTMGNRNQFLRSALESIKKDGRVYVIVTAPRKVISEYMSTGVRGIDEFIADDNKGLSAAINKACKSMPKNIRFITWLGDDDALIYKNFIESIHILEKFPNVVATYGKIYFINEKNQIFWKLKPRFFAQSLIRFGPNRIPQPGSLLRRSTFEEIGGLDEKLKFAFDTDLFIRLQKVGKLKYLDKYVAYFRWHKDSLSAGQSSSSLKEASLVRKSHLNNFLKIISVLWEPLQLYLGAKLPNRIDLKNYNFESLSNQ